MSVICRCWGVSGVVQPSIIKAITAASPDRKLMQLPYNVMPHRAKKAPPRRDQDGDCRVEAVKGRESKGTEEVGLWFDKFGCTNEE
jgi:hypothetical protein